MKREIIQQELKALTDDAGFIKPASVVQWAKRHPESELHKHFEWNDRLAAEQHRLDQARQLIAVYIRNDDGHRMTISLIRDRHVSGGYRQLDRVLANAELRAMALRQALEEFQRWQERYQYLLELARIFEAAAVVRAEVMPAPPPGGEGDAAGATEVAGA